MVVFGCSIRKKVGNQYVPHGTGILLYNYDTTRPHIIITCAHILRNTDISVVIPMTSKGSAQLKLLNARQVLLGKTIWTIEENKLRGNIKLKEDSSFVSDQKLDIGALFFEHTNTVEILKNGNADTMRICNLQFIPKSRIKLKKDIRLGIDVYFVGFPFSIGTSIGFLASNQYMSETPNPLLRFGSVAWKSEASSEFLIDAFSYGGNSGSPVFTQTDLINPQSYLIGMIVGHLPSEKSDNNGLARAIWVDDIIEIIQKLNKIKY